MSVGIIFIKEDACLNPLILIAEDDADIRALLRLYLEGDGFRVL